MGLFNRENNYSYKYILIFINTFTVSCANLMSFCMLLTYNGHCAEYFFFDFFIL